MAEVLCLKISGGCFLYRDLGTEENRGGEILIRIGEADNF